MVNIFVIFIYYKNYGFVEAGVLLAIWEENSRKLITKYFRDEET